jgi:hypothetical protein
MLYHWSHNPIPFGCHYFIVKVNKVFTFMQRPAWIAILFTLPEKLQWHPSHPGFIGWNGIMSFLIRLALSFLIFLIYNSWVAKITGMSHCAQLLITLMSIFSKESKSTYERDTCRDMFITSVFTTAKLWNHPINRWMDKENMIYINNWVLFSHNEKLLIIVCWFCILILFQKCLSDLRVFW